MSAKDEGTPEFRGNPESVAKVDYKVSFSDGSVKNRPLGYYWRMQIADGHFGDDHGPFNTEDEARQNATNYFDINFFRLTRGFRS